MAAVFEYFVSSPSHEPLQRWTKQLIKLAWRYNMALDTRRTKETNNTSILPAYFQQEGVSVAGGGGRREITATSWPGLTCEQQRELEMWERDKEFEKIKYLKCDKINKHEKYLERMKYKMEQIKFLCPSHSHFTLKSEVYYL